MGGALRHGILQLTATSKWIREERSGWVMSLVKKDWKLKQLCHDKYSQSLHKMRQEMNWRAGQRAEGEGLFQALL